MPKKQAGWIGLGLIGLPPLAREVRAAYQRMAKSQLVGEDFISIVKRT